MTLPAGSAQVVSTLGQQVQHRAQRRQQEGRQRVAITPLPPPPVVEDDPESLRAAIFDWMRELRAVTEELRAAPPPHPAPATAAQVQVQTRGRAPPEFWTALETGEEAIDKLLDAAASLAASLRILRAVAGRPLT